MKEAIRETIRLATAILCAVAVTGALALLEKIL